jgi:hypothetical protein
VGAAPAIPTSITPRHAVQLGEFNAMSSTQRRKDVSPASQDLRDRDRTKKQLLLGGFTLGLAALGLVGLFVFVRVYVLCFGLACLNGYVSAQSIAETTYALPGRYCLTTSKRLYSRPHRQLRYGGAADFLMSTVYMVYPTTYLFVVPVSTDAKPVVAIKATHLTDQSTDVEFCSSDVRLIYDNSGLRFVPKSGG